MQLINLQIAVLADDKNQIHAALADIDRVTENEAMLRAGKHFGFATVEACGKRVANRADLARVFGYGDESGIRKMADRYDLEALSIATYGQNVRRFIVESLGLSKHNGQAILADWRTFLVAAMSSTLPAADPVKRYLLECERAARVSAGVVDVARAEAAKIKRTAEVVRVLAQADRLKDPQLRRLAYERVNELLDASLALPQLELFAPPPA